MFHPTLRVNGKAFSDEGELERLLTTEHFHCYVDDQALDVEFTGDHRGAFIGWTDDYDDEVYYFDNGSGNTEPVDLAINVCPEERMMCYDMEVIRDVVTYFCRTGGRAPNHQWIQDER